MSADRALTARGFGRFLARRDALAIMLAIVLWCVGAALRLWEEHESPYALTAQVLQEWGATSLAIDPALAFAMFDGLRLAAPDMAMPSAAPVVDGCRAIKSPAELALMSQAKAMTLEVHRRAARILRPGVTTAEVRRFIDQAHRALGADDGSSFCAVQFGEASAYPHGLPGEQQLQDGEIVLIDTGCRVQGYNSDITRTYAFGTPTQEQRRVWDVEKKAQAAAFAAVKPGVPCEEIDAVARRVCPTAPATVSGCRSTRRPISSAATRPPWLPACASPTNR